MPSSRTASGQVFWMAVRTLPDPTFDRILRKMRHQARLDGGEYRRWGRALGAVR